MPVTLKQLAHDLGLHHSTVAYALSGKGTVKEATRQRVRAAAAQMGYVPNGLARRMRAKKTNVIGLVIPDVLIDFNDLIQCTFRAAMKRGYDAQIAMTEFKQDWEDKAVRFLMESRVDGLIIKSTYKQWSDVPDSHALRQLVSQHVPAVLYGFPIEGSPFPYVALPHERQGEMLTEHLLSLGHRRLAWLLPGRGPLGRSHESRVAGSRKAVVAAGLPADTVRVVTLDDVPVVEAPTIDDGNDACVGQLFPRAGIRGGRALLRRAMAAGADERPTAVLCVNEITAIGATAEAHEMGLRLPHDLAIAAANRSVVASELSPISLTTADVDISEVANLALDLLLATVRDHEANRQPGINGNGAAADEEPAAPAFVSPAPKLVIGRSTQPR